MNVGIFSGHIGRDAEVNQGSNNDPVANFPLAVNVGTQTNQDTMWIDCALWGKRADSLAQYLVKGQKVTVAGRQRTETFTKRDGSVGFKLVLNVIEVDIHFAPRSGDQAPAPARAAAPAKSAPRSVADLDSDIPF